MCLTGVDYFSTLGYQPGIAFLAAGALAPIATVILVLLTLFGALPVYNKVAEASPNGQGSISMLEDLLPRWRGKAFVLVLLGFAATDYIITITLSSADATAHIIHNPFVPAAFDHPVGVTLVLLAALGAIFLKGFKEAIGLAVAIVALYLVMNVAIIGWGLREILQHPEYLPRWKDELFAQHGNPFMMLGVALILFPKLALGLSGFETGVAVMPLVEGDPEDTREHPVGRIRNTKKLLRTAALWMSVLLIGSALVTTLLIPAEAFQEGGAASGRALSYLAHEHLGEVFGTIYDFSTIAILWFAGASAIAGLLNLVPRYLPRYGMAPEWTRATRPLVVLFTATTFLITLIFNADVTAQGGAYATGVLVLMTSAAVAATLTLWKRGSRQWPAFVGVTLLFAYTTVTNVFERPDGVKIAAWFIVTIVATSLISRVLRSTELRVHGITPDLAAAQFLRDASDAPLRIIANRPDSGLPEEYAHKLREATDSHHLPPGERVLFVEVRSSNASDFSDVLAVEGVDVGGHHVLRCASPAIPNAIAALLLFIRDRTGQIPHAYFGWTEGNPIAYLLKFLAFGEGDTAPVTREVLR
ncbi:MAG: amino acid transporter [Acidobacteria bacterium]|nr:amino acid transporter [Acidobacteriota bacterium]